MSGDRNLTSYVYILFLDPYSAIHCHVSASICLSPRIVLSVRSCGAVALGCEKKEKVHRRNAESWPWPLGSVAIELSSGSEFAQDDGGVQLVITASVVFIADVRCPGMPIVLFAPER